ncbi:FRIGIDA-like protein [Quillaja saponaria]|uniref:FRIGIDA-like protein n=1 Tax=Quillaja saponaria TaxID=32244 RepID=A0AAD7P707_QUISA|nr:FRIGIDA-like protein [Quillaja saponaria]
MADMEQAEVNGTLPVIEQLRKAFLELEAHRDASEDKVQWVEIENHFCNLETALKEKLAELEAKEREYEEKEAETNTLLVERKAAVASNEQDLVDWVQELKDAAISAIVEARAYHQPPSLVFVNDVEDKDSKVSSSLTDTNSPDEEFSCKSGDNGEGVAVGVKSCPEELIQFCEQMDAQGLLKYIMENKKNLSIIREELSTALEPARLVLDLLEGLYPSDETTQPGDKRGAALHGMHKSCLVFMEAMAILLARADPGADHILNPETKQQAKAIADEWKPNFSLPLGLLQSLNEEELCKLVLAVAHRRQAPELCRSIGLTHKVPGVIELLVNNWKQIAAVHFIHAFQLCENFPPVPLLKAYLKDLRRNSQGKAGNPGRCSGVEEYNLESDYPLDPLHKRVTQLEKSKADKKRIGEFGKRHQPKKPRANGGYFGFWASSGNAASSAVMGRQALPARAVYTGMPERYPPAGQNIYDYQVPSQPVYAQQANDQRSYYYPPDDRVTPSSYNAAPSNYGSYVGSSLQPSQQPYK